MSLLDKGWEDIQQRTFTRWVNAQLIKRGIKIQDITTDFSDGLNLIALYEIISDSKFGSYQKKPVMKIHKINNLSIVIDEVNKFVDSVGVKVRYSAEQVHDGDKRTLLGMIWCLIHKFSIQDISEEEMSARDGLLLWCQKQTAGYPGVKVQNFNTSWQDGLAFCALIHKYRPDLIDFSSLSGADKAKNLQLAFDVAEKHLDIPQLLDANDIVGTAKPDDKSIMTYVAYYWKKFAAGKKAEKSGRKVTRIAEMDKQNSQIASDYEARAKKLIDWIGEKNTTLSDTSNFGNSLVKVQQTSNNFKQFKNEEKPKQGAEKTDIELLLKNLNTKQKNEGLQLYVPPEELSTNTINQRWDELEATSSKYDKAVREAIQRMKQIELLLARFRSRAQQLNDWNTSKQAYLSEDIRKIEQISAIQARIKGQEAFDEELKATTGIWEETKKLGQEVIDAKHEAADEVQNTINERQAALEESGRKSQAVMEELNKWLKHKQEIEANCIEFATTVQQLNLFLEDIALALVEPVSANSVQEVEDKQSANEALVESHTDKKSIHDKITELHNSITAAGADSGVYSSLSYDAITEKYNRIKEQLDQRTAELAKAKEVQEYNEKLLSEWADQVKEYQGWTEEKKSLLQKEEGASLTEQLSLLQEKATATTAESTERLEKLDAHYSKLAEADVVNKVETTMQECRVLHSQIENIIKRRTEDLQVKIKQLENVVARFKSRISKIQAWQGEKSAYLNAVTSKVTTISSIQAELKTLQGLSHEYKGIEATFEETKGIGEVIVMSKHASADEVKQAVADAEAANAKLKSSTDEASAKLEELLKQKQEIETNCLEFAKLVQQLVLFLEDAQNTLVDSAKARSVKDVEDKIAAVNKIADSHKTQQATLDSARFIHDKVTAAGAKSDVYSSVDIDAISNKYEQTGKQIEAKLGELAQEKQQQENHATLLKEFADSCAAYSKFVNDQTNEISKETEGALEEQLETLKKNGATAVSESAAQLKKLGETYAALEAADIAELADVSLQELQVLDAQIQKAVSQRIQTIEQQIIAKKLGNVSEQQLKEFTDAFNHFDAQKTGFLTKLQFKSACAAVGEDIPDEKLEATFKSYDNDNDGKISLPEFVEFMSSVAKEGVGYNDVLEAFQELAGGNPFITEAQMRAVLDSKQVDYLVTRLPKTEQGYDYKAFADSSFAKA
jgi:actinin alpha